VGVLPLIRRLVGEQVAKTEALEAANGNGATVRDPKIREFLSEIKKDTILKNSDFSTPFKEQPGQAATAAPTDDALLVSEMALTPLANGHMKIKFAGKPVDSSQIRNVQIDLDERLMHGFLHLLEKSYATSEWGKTAVVQADSEAASDQAADTGRPQYLN
jgi:Arc/MetJ family transcription regulator